MDLRASCVLVANIGRVIKTYKSGADSVFSSVLIWSSKSQHGESYTRNRIATGTQHDRNMIATGTQHIRNMYATKTWPHTSNLDMRSPAFITYELRTCCDRVAIVFRA